MNIKFLDLGLVEFSWGLSCQRECFDKVKNGFIDAAVILCRHFPVITVGRSVSALNMSINRDMLREKKIEVVEVERGGDVTYHGPGQQMVYIVTKLDYFAKDLHYFMEKIERLAIDILFDCGLKGTSKEGLRGVWFEDKKIVSVGIAVRNWITYYGFAINVKNDDLSNFSLIRPCGMDIIMTSLETALGRENDFLDITKTVRRRLEHGQGFFA